MRLSSTDATECNLRFVSLPSRWGAPFRRAPAAPQELFEHSGSAPRSLGLRWLLEALVPSPLVVKVNFHFGHKPQTFAVYFFKKIYKSFNFLETPLNSSFPCLLPRIQFSPNACFMPRTPNAFGFLRYAKKIDAACE